MRMCVTLSFEKIKHIIMYTGAKKKPNKITKPPFTISGNLHHLTNAMGTTKQGVLLFRGGL